MLSLHKLLRIINLISWINTSLTNINIFIQFLIFSTLMINLIQNLKIDPSFSIFFEYTHIILFLHFLFYRVTWVPIQRRCVVMITYVLLYLHLYLIYRFLWGTDWTFVFAEKKRRICKWPPLSQRRIAYLSDQIQLVFVHYPVFLLV